MFQRVSTKGGIRLETGDRVFDLRVEDFPKPIDPGDAYDVEQRIQALIDKFAGLGRVKVHIYYLDPLYYNITTTPNPENDPIPDYWWHQ